MRKAAGTAAALVLVAVCTIAGYVVWTTHQGSDVQGSATVEFDPVPLPARPASPPPPAVTPPRRVEWPTYGFDDQRRRFDPTVGLRPPFRKTWTFRGRALLEFPPAVAYGRLYLPTFDGRFYALDSRTGKTIWRHHTGRCGWATPAVWRRVVYVAFIGRRQTCNDDVPGDDGEVIAFDADDGSIRWRRTVGPTESSPVVAGGLVYLGDWDGTVWALDVATGRTRWRYSASGQIKGSPALAGGLLYLGDYAGHVYALRARTGRLVWRSSAQPRLGSSGRFYSTPSVAYGRVYIGSTDGKVYSFGARSGKLRWSHSTGSYVYSSPAVWNGLVLVGSYDHRFYALDAATGNERWSYRAGGPISGAATVIAGVVYFSSFDERTHALDAATGRPVWAWPDGKYSPVVADGERLYLVGLGRLYGMVERR